MKRTRRTPAVSSRIARYGNRCLRVLALAVCTFCSTGWWVLASASAPDNAATVTLAELVDEAYRANPAIRQAREKWRAVVESYRVSTGYPDPHDRGDLFHGSDRNPTGSPGLERHLDPADSLPRKAG